MRDAPPESGAPQRSVHRQDHVPHLRINLLFPFAAGKDAIMADAGLKMMAFHMRAQAGAEIVRGGGSSVAYAASKAALNAMTLSLARNLGPEIRVNVVCPSMVTGRWHLEHLGAERYEAQMRSWENATPLRRRVNPEDVASAVVWLIEGAEAMTGQVLVVDSGSSLGAPPRRN